MFTKRRSSPPLRPEKPYRRRAADKKTALTPTAIFKNLPDEITLIGAGGGGAVYRDGSEWVFKILFKQSNGGNRVKTARKIAQAWKKNGHSASIGYDERKGPYVKMPYLHGDSRWLSRIHSVSSEVFVMVARRLIKVVDDLREQNGVHGDLKPDNILLSWSDDDDDDEVTLNVLDWDTSTWDEEPPYTPITTVGFSISNKKVRMGSARDAYAIAMIIVLMCLKRVLPLADEFDLLAQCYGKESRNLDSPEAWIRATKDGPLTDVVSQALDAVLREDDVKNRIKAWLNV